MSLKYVSTKADLKIFKAEKVNIKQNLEILVIANILLKV